MGRVTVGAALADRLVFPQQRTAELGVTAGAGFIDGAPDEPAGARRPVGRMAARAGHLALGQRMM